MARARWPLPRPALPRTTSLSTPLASARVDAPDGFGLRVCALCRKPVRGSDPLKDATATLLKKHGLMLAAPSSTYAHDKCRSVIRAAASKLSKKPPAPAPGPGPGAHRRSQGAPAPTPPPPVLRASSYPGGWNGAGVPINGMDAPTLQPRGSALRAGAAAGRSSAAHGADGARDGGSAGGGAARQSAAALTCNLRAPPARDGPDAYSSAPPSKRARATAASVPQQENQPPQLTQPPPEELRPVGHLLGGRTTAAMHVHRRGGAAPNRVRLSPEQRVALGSRANWLHLTPDERMLRGKNEYRGRLAAQVCTAPQLHAHAALRTVVAGPPANPPDSAPLCGEIPATHDPFALARDLSVPSLPHGLTPTRSSQVAQASAEGRERTLRKRTDSLLKEVVALRMQVGAERRVKKAKAKAAMGVVEHEVFVAAARRCKEKGLSDICGNFAKAILSTDPRAQLHLSGSYAVDLSDASSNIRRPFKNTYIFSPSNKLKMVTQYSAPSAAASLQIELQPPRRQPPVSIGQSCHRTGELVAAE